MSEILQVPIAFVVRECLENSFREIFRFHLSDAMLRFPISQVFFRPVDLVDTVPDGKGVSRQGNTAFDIVFEEVHLNLFPRVRMGKMKDQYVIALYVV